MRIAICCLYITLQLIYLSFGDVEVGWGCFNIVTHLAFVAYLCYELEKVNKFSKDEILLFQYIKYISISFSLYTIACCIRGNSFVILNTPVSSYILGIGFLSFILHSLLNRK